MIRVRATGKWAKKGDPFFGYGEWMVSEHNRSDGKRGWNTHRIYEAPNNVAVEMISKGARIDE